MEKEMKYPFVYIASMMRTGSTVLQEALTQLPNSFIFHEPQLCRGKFDIKDKFLVDLPFNVKKRIKKPILETFSKKVVPDLNKHIKQIGVKEIENRGWRNYLKFFPDTKIILTGRNPKDIYISIHYWFARKKTNKWKDGRILTPEVLYESLNKEFLIQLIMRHECKAIKVRYEDLCLHPDVTMGYVRDFINSPIESIGDVGGFLSNNPKRKDEHQLHKNSITDSRICRWKKESDKNLVKQACEFYNLMEDYCEFWGY